MQVDTSVMVSTLVFQAGPFNWLRTAWRTEQVVPVVSLETVAELVRVLAYPMGAVLVTQDYVAAALTIH